MCLTYICIKSKYNYHSAITHLIQVWRTYYPSIMKSSIICSLILLIISIATSSAFTPSVQSSRRALIGSKSKRKPITTLSVGDAAETPKKKKATKKKATKKKAKVANPEESNGEEEVVTFRKPEFVSKIAEKTGMSKADSEAALSAVLETITEVC